MPLIVLNTCGIQMQIRTHSVTWSRIKMFLHSSGYLIDCHFRTWIVHAVKTGAYVYGHVLALPQQSLGIQILGYIFIMAFHLISGLYRLEAVIPERST